MLGHVSLRRLVFLASFLLFSGCASPGTTQSEHVDAGLGDDYFEPLGNLTQGTEVRFQNVGARNHTVTIHLEWVPEDEYEIDQRIEPGATVAFTFEEEAVYHVWCRFHGEMGRGMHVNVTVEE